jgi:hypothetical protein
VYLRPKGLLSTQKQFAWPVLSPATEQWLFTMLAGHFASYLGIMLEVNIPSTVEESSELNFQGLALSLTG